uniref:ANK_REP_REGION domain-containing protein n=1 Tax=Ascaris lumbricoides TaxID=6252 RepID=A0A0M3IL48_ASCLU
MSGFASLPELLLSYMQLTGAVAVQRAPHLFAALAIVLQVAASDLLDEVRQYLENNWAYFAQFDADGNGPLYYALEMANGRCHDLIIEAVCRMKGIQIMARRLHDPIGNSAIFGCRGPIFEVVEANDQWFTLSERIVPWIERVHGLSEPGQSIDITESSRPGTSRDDEKTRVGQIASGKVCKRRPNPKVKLFARLSHFHRTISAAQQRAAHILRLAKRALRHRVHLDRDTAVVDITPLAQRTAGASTMLDDATRRSGQERQAVVAEAAPHEDRERRESGIEENVNPVADLRVVDPVDEVLPAMQEDEPDMADPVVEALPEREEDEADAASPSEVLPAVELLELPEPPYEIDGGAYVCRLPRCPSHNKRFGSLKAWKLHASHTGTHIAQGYCTGCNRYVMAPPEAGPVEMKVWLRAHKRERCEGAPRQVIKERRRELLRLETLGRDTTHLQIPGLAKRDGERLNSELFPGALEEADEADRRVARKRAYPTEDERRLGLCLSYVKRFKASNPGRLQEIAADFDLLFA